MDESELVLKTAELALSKSKAELYDDALKIGIPSIVALAGIVSTYFLTTSSHKKDLKIQALQVKYDAQKEMYSCTGDLIKNIAIGLTELHKTMLTYAGHLSAKISMEKDGLTFPEKNRKELSSQYLAYVDILHESFSIEAQTFLLGKNDIDQKFENYRSAISDLSMNFSPSIGPDRLEELQNKLLKIRDFREVLFKSLSKVYLVNEKSG